MEHPSLTTAVIRVIPLRFQVMQEKLTLSIDEEVYEGLRETVGPRRISRFIEDLVRPHVVRRELYAAYEEMAANEAREAEALEWSEATCTDIHDEET